MVDLRPDMDKLLEKLFSLLTRLIPTGMSGYQQFSLFVLNLAIVLAFIVQPSYIELYFAGYFLCMILIAMFTFFQKEK